MGETQNQPFQLKFNASLKRQQRGVPGIPEGRTVTDGLGWRQARVYSQASERQKANFG
jgi:hypothetical protein